MLTADPVAGTHLFATCSYSAMRDGWGVPIRTSLGHPRFKLQYRIEEYVEEVTPKGVFRNPAYTDDAQMEAAYVIRLNENAAAIEAAFEALQAKHGDRPLVFLCFENVHEGKACHRRWLADWMQLRFGFEVPEISPPVASRSRPKARPDDPRLF